MADDRSKRDFRDRDRVSTDEEYELEYFAQTPFTAPPTLVHRDTEA